MFTNSIFFPENNLRKPAYFNTKIDGVSAYNTKDLVIFHPDHPKYFKLVGRASEPQLSSSLKTSLTLHHAVMADDQIIHSTGVSLSVAFKLECVAGH
jgi:hypothetical protein